MNYEEGTKATVFIKLNSCYFRYTNMSIKKLFWQFFPASIKVPTLCSRVQVRANFRFLKFEEHSLTRGSVSGIKTK